MKKCLLVFSVILILISCNKEKKDNGLNENDPNYIIKLAEQENQNENQKKLETTTIQFDALEFEFGSIKQGSKVVKYFPFKNTGKKPLIIQEVYTSCGCTAPKFPKTAVLPNEKDSILLEYNSTGHSGQINKKATVVANIPSEIQLILKGNIQ